MSTYTPSSATEKSQLRSKIIILNTYYAQSQNEIHQNRGPAKLDLNIQQTLYCSLFTEAETYCRSIATAACHSTPGEWQWCAVWQGHEPTKQMTENQRHWQQQQQSKTKFFQMVYHSPLEVLSIQSRADHQLNQPASQSADQTVTRQQVSQPSSWWMVAANKTPKNQLTEFKWMFMLRIVSPTTRELLYKQVNQSCIAGILLQG